MYSGSMIHSRSSASELETASSSSLKSIVQTFTHITTTRTSHTHLQNFKIKCARSFARAKASKLCEKENQSLSFHSISMTLMMEQIMLISIKMSCLSFLSFFSPCFSAVVVHHHHHHHHSRSVHIAFENFSIYIVFHARMTLDVN